MKPQRDPVVVFDLGGVLCRFEPDRRLQALSVATGLPAVDIDQAIWQSGLDARAEMGELERETVVELIVNALQGRLDAAGLRAAWSLAFPVDVEVCEIVSALAAPPYVFTDNGPLLTDCLDHELRPIRSLARRVICSWELRACKPDPVAFQRLAHEVGCSPRDIVLVDDSVNNCKAAASAGAHVIHFQGPPQLRERLQRERLIG